MPDNTIPSEAIHLPGPRVVAFIDILGMRELIAEVFQRGNLDFYRTLVQGLRLLAVQAQITTVHPFPANVQAVAFSDSIVVSAPEGPVGALNLLTRVGLLAGWLLRERVLCRGGIAIGPTHHDEYLLFGPGVVRAYDLESTAAFYPRIVVTDEIATLIDPTPFARLKLDHDGLWYIDMFFQLQEHLSLQRALEGSSLAEFAGTPTFDHAAFESARTFISESIRREKVAPPEQRQESRLAKYRWLAGKFNEAVHEFGLAAIDRIPLRFTREGS